MVTKIENVDLFALALSLLSDEYGISQDAYENLASMLVISGNENLLGHVVMNKAGRFYIGEPGL